MSRTIAVEVGIVFALVGLALAGPYGPGAPSKGDPPKAPGEYRIKDAAGNIKYIGETKDLQRRKKEHEKSGKKAPGGLYEYKVAKPETSTDERRTHEKQKIKKHAPAENKSKGGEGRIMTQECGLRVSAESAGVHLSVRRYLTQLSRQGSNPA